MRLLLSVTLAVLAGLGWLLLALLRPAKPDVSVGEPITGVSVWKKPGWWR